MALCSREGHHQSNQDEVQKRMKTSSWSRSRVRLISQLFPRSCPCFRLSDFGDLYDTFGKRVDGQGGQNERRGWGNQVSRHGRILTYK